MSNRIAFEDELTEKVQSMFYDLATSDMVILREMEQDATVEQIGQNKNLKSIDHDGFVESPQYDCDFVLTERK